MQNGRPVNIISRESVTMKRRASGVVKLKALLLSSAMVFGVSCWSGSARADLIFTFSCPTSSHSANNPGGIVVTSCSPTGTGDFGFNYGDPSSPSGRAMGYRDFWQYTFDEYTFLGVEPFHNLTGGGFSAYLVGYANSALSVPVPTTAPAVTAATTPTFTPDQKARLTAASIGLTSIGTNLAVAGAAFGGVVISSAEAALGGLMQSVNFANITGNLKLTPVQQQVIFGLGTGASIAATVASLAVNGAVCQECAAVQLVGLSLSTLGGGLGLLAADPPDPDYKNVYSLSPPTVTASQLSTLGAYAQPVADALNASAKLQATVFRLLDYRQKYDGAVAAGDTFYANWLASQFQSAAADVAPAYQSYLDAMKNTIASIKLGGDLAIDPGVLAQITALVANRLTPEMSQLFDETGFRFSFTDAEIQAFIAGDSTIGPSFSDVFSAVDAWSATAQSGFAAFALAGQQPVPEPGGLAVFGTSLAVAALIRRRKKRAIAGVPA